MSLGIAERGGLNDSGLGNYMENGASRRGAGVWGKDGKLVFGMLLPSIFSGRCKGVGTVLCSAI